MTAVASLPCNSRIAAALLDVLGTSGDIGGRARALRLAGADAGSVRVPKAWIGEASLRAMFDGVADEDRLLERVGQSLVSPDSLGFALWYAGFATPEKALRRCDQIFARESREGYYQALEIGVGRAAIAYYPGEGDEPWAPYCRVRAGMIRALPLLFGLLPAAVEETQCVTRGAAHCEFRARWDAGSRQGLVSGVFLGAGVCGATVLALLGIGAGWALAGAASAGALLGAALGRSRDLARQLEAVAGARRGQLALLDQADRMLAERMDSLAKLDSAAHAASGLQTTRTQAQADDDASAQSHWWAETVAGLRGTGQELSHVVSALEESGGQLSSSRLAELKDATRGVEEIEARVAERARSLEGPFEATDIAAIARHAARLVRNELRSRPQGHEAEPTPIRIDLALAHGGGRALLECRPFQIEEALVQLLRNGVAASAPGAVVRLELERSDDSYALSVRDLGPGFPDGVLEGIFDPFDSASEASGPLGLQIVSRIAKEHQGELRIESESGNTRVTLLLPRR